MAGQVVQMDYPVVQSTAKGFRQQADVVTTIGKIAVGIFTSLEASSFFFPPLAKYFARCKEAVKNKSKELADTLKEFGADLDQAVQDHKNGDFEGKRYFGTR
jgi:hypothetical protein